MKRKEHVCIVMNTNLYSTSSLTISNIQLISNIFDIILSAVKRYYEMEKYIYQTNLRENKLKKKWFHFRKYFEGVGNVLTFF